MNGEERFIGTDEICVVVTCHGDYWENGYIGEQVAHIDAQRVRPAQRIIAYDGADWAERMKSARERFPQWMFVGADGFGNPNVLRNKALAICQAPFIVFADADDFMGIDYVENALAAVSKHGTDNVGVFYADLHYSNGKKLIAPDKIDYWKLRLQNCVSAASVWRVEAIIEAGGWKLTDCFDDWTLALDITVRGWKCAKINSPIMCRWHAGHRRDNAREKEFAHKWERSYAIVTLLSGHEGHALDIFEWFGSETLPPKTTVYIVDNSNSEQFSGYVIHALSRLQRQKGVVTVYLHDNSVCDDKSDALSRHRHVPRLYNRVMPRVVEDMVLTLEDDVLPPHGAMMRIVHSFPAAGKCGAVAGIYQSRHSVDGIVAAFGMSKELKYEKEKDYWRAQLTWADVKGKELVGVDFVGGGFTLYNNALLKRFLPFRFLNWHGKASGWDANLSRSIRQAGYSLYVDPQIKCEHNFNK